MWRVLFFLGMAFVGLAPLAHLSYLYGVQDAFIFLGEFARKFGMNAGS